MPNRGFDGIYIVRLAVFYAFLFILLILNLIDLPFMAEDSGRLAFLLIGIYFWTIYRPSLLPYPLIFCAGLFLDFLSGGLVGLYALCFMVLGMIVRSQRRFLLGQSWPVIWAGFCVALIVVTILQMIAYGVSVMGVSATYSCFIQSVYIVLSVSLVASPYDALEPHPI